MNIAKMMVSPHPSVRRLAARALHYGRMRDDGKIRHHEYEMLCRQLLAREELERAAEDAEQRAALHQAAEALRLVLGVVL